MNRLYTCHNGYQGGTKRVLCVCSAGLLRSPTAANIIHKVFGHNTRACGISIDFALVPFDNVLATWADEIVVMESWMAHNIPNEFQDKIICLNIEDSFAYMDIKLQQLIKDKYAAISE